MSPWRAEIDHTPPLDGTWLFVATLRGDELPPAISVVRWATYPTVRTTMFAWRHPNGAIACTFSHWMLAPEWPS